jgi:hypothetical protein
MPAPTTHAPHELIAVCAWCGRVRDDAGVWRHPEGRPTGRSCTELTHGICADCVRERFPEFAE